MVPPRANAARSLSRLCLLLMGCCVLATLGCSGSRQQVQTDLVHRQMRLQEDEIYRLEDYLEEYQALVRGYRCEIADLERQLASQTGSSSDAERPTPAPPASEPEPTLAAPADAMPAIEMPDVGASESATGDLPAPAFDPPAEEAPPFDAGAVIDDETGVSLAGAIEPTKRLETPPTPYPATRTIEPPTGTDERLRLGIEPGEHPGELRVLVTGALGATDGRISVMLTDPTAEGRLRRIARWDYTPEETAAARQGDDDGGAKLDLPIALPAGTPRDQPLRLWVRLLDGQERRLQAAPISLDGEGRPVGLTSLLSEPRRLPEIGPMRAIAEAAPTQPTVEPGWRAARRPDRSVLTVSYEEPVE